MSWTERYIRADADGSGNGTTDANSGTNGSWTLAQAISSEAAGQRVNVKTGIYANTTTNRVVAVAGTTTQPIWWRGYNTTIGDCDTDFTLAVPAITFTTGQFQINASHRRFSNLSFTGALTTGTVVFCAFSAATVGLDCDNVSVENTAAASGATALVPAYFNTHGVWTRCRFKATSTASMVVDLTQNTSATGTSFAGCVFVGGGDGCRLAAVANSGGYVFYRCCFRSVGGIGISDPGTLGGVWILGCTFKLSGADGYKATATRTDGPVVIIDSVLDGNGAYGLQNSTGTASGQFHRLCNLFGGPNTSGKENGFGDTPSLSEKVDAGASTVSSTDLTLGAASSGRNNALPGGATGGTFNGETYTSCGDRGAVRHQDPAGGSGGVVFSPGLDGGAN
jgi:hypothetical protein